MQNLTDADWERLKRVADALEQLADELERRKIPAEAEQLDTQPTPAATAGFLLEATEQRKALHDEQ